MKTDIKKVELFANEILDFYQEIAQTKYANLLKTNPEALRLYSKSNVKLFRVNVNDNFLQFDDYLFFVYCVGAKFELIELDLSDSSYYTYDTPVFNKEPIDILIENTKDVVRSNVVYERELYPHAKIRKSEAESILRREASLYNEHINKPQGYYAKNAAKYAYSELDLRPIIDKVNNDDFSYQLDQAIAAYDNSLFLPACATLGVCLETVCKLLLVKEGEKVKDSDTTLLDQLGLKLRERKIISYKMNSRIDVCYKVRNLASHTSPGKVVKQDCHFILNTISEIVDTYF